MIPLYKPFIPELPDLDKVLKSGQLASGKYTDGFEHKLSEYIQTEHVLSTNSFSSAIWVALASLGIKHGDEVIVSPMACLASTQSLFTAGISLKWADIDPHTGTLNPDSVRNTITKKTKAIVHNHFCGYPGFIDEINEIGKEYGLCVIDDGIECFGAKYKGKMVGNCGTDATVFSFNPVRVLTTIDGGAIMFKDKHQNEQGILIRDCGVDRPSFRDDLGEIRPECDITVQGYSATLSNVGSYIGIQQFKSLDSRLNKQRKNAERWRCTLSEYGKYTPLKTQNGEPNYWVFGILADDKRGCINKFRSLGYYASGVHVNNNIYSVFGRQETLPGVQEFYDSFVALPCGWWMDEEN